MDKGNKLSDFDAREQQLRETREAWLERQAKDQADRDRIARQAHDVTLAEMTRTTPPTQ